MRLILFGAFKCEKRSDDFGWTNCFGFTKHSIRKYLFGIQYGMRRAASDIAFINAMLCCIQMPNKCNWSKSIKDRAQFWHYIYLFFDVHLVLWHWNFMTSVKTSNTWIAFTKSQYLLCQIGQFQFCTVFKLNRELWLLLL